MSRRLYRRWRAYRLRCRHSQRLCGMCPLVAAQHLGDVRVATWP